MRWYVKWEYGGNVTGPYADLDEAKMAISENICGFEREADDDGMGLIFSDAIFLPEVMSVVKVNLKDGHNAMVTVIVPEGDWHD